MSCHVCPVIHRDDDDDGDDDGGGGSGPGED